MNTAMTYDKLYSNMVKKFTVEKNNVEYKLGDYMMMKAGNGTRSGWISTGQDISGASF